MERASPQAGHEPERSPGRGGEARDDEREAAVLADRARELARVDAPAPDNLVVVITFGAGEERFAVPVERVLRVERIERVTRVPYATRGVVGLFNLQGRPCALLDVPALLAPAAPEPQARRWAVVLGRRHPELALAADDVEAEEIERPPPQPGPFQLGLTPEACILLDADALLAPADSGAAAGGAS